MGITVKSTFDFHSCGYETSQEEDSLRTCVPDLSGSNAEVILTSGTYYCASRQAIQSLALSEDHKSLTLGGIVTDDLKVLGRAFTSAGTQFASIASINAIETPQ
jgi:hypothetical protein